MTSKSKQLSEARLRTIFKRQTCPTWDGDYIPSILATPKEAPSISRAFVLTPEKLAGRETHLLSTPERNAAFLGLYHPKVVGLHEQRMLDPDPSTHPLWTFPEIDRTRLVPTRGIIDVAERHGFLDILPRIMVADRKHPEAPRTAVFPWCGDLLWAIREEDDGEVYCVNWSVKSKYEDFKRPGPQSNGKMRSGESTRKALARHTIEEAYYKDPGIRTVRVADEAIDPHVTANLRQLFLHHRRPLGLTEEQQAEILDQFEIAFRAEIPPSEVIISFIERGRFTQDQCRSALYQAIWYRKLRVDLFTPVLINRPLCPETRDVLDVYGDWFRRS